MIIGENVNNLVFDGLIFEHATWNFPSNFSTILNSNNGFCIEQADWYIDVQLSTDINAVPMARLVPSPISFKNSSYVIFKDNTFKHIGSIGLRFSEGCNNNKICNNYFKDISASGICIGNDSQNPSLSNNNLITNNLIENIANEYMGSIGIFIMAKKSTTIANNEIKNFPYSGISLGWGWSEGYNSG